MNVPINPNEILEVTPLQMVTPYDLVAKRPRTSHARRTKETTRRPKKPNSDQTSQSSVPPSKEELTKEGSRYDHNAISKIVTHILNENNVTSRISVPLNSVLPESNDIAHVSDNAGNYVQANNDRNANVNEENDDVNMDVHLDDNKRNDGVKDTVGKDDVIVNNDHTEVPGGAVYNEEVPSNVSADKCVNHTKDGQTEEKEPEKTQANKVINLDDLSDDDRVASINPSIAKRLTRRKGKQVVVEDSQKKKVVVKPTSVGPKKPWSKVVPKKRKARIIAENESDSDVAVDVNDIHPNKKVSTSKLATSVPKVPIDNISFHYPSSVLRWKFVYQKRLALERELAQNALEYEEIMNLIHEAGLMKTATQFSKYYEVLVKEFIVNLHEDCGNKKTKEYLKVFVRGKCVNFSPTVINKFLERSNEARPELEVSDNQVCKVITAGQVKTWPVKGKLNASKLSVKYAILHRIGAAYWVPTQHKSTIFVILGKFIFAIGTKTKVDYGTYIFEQTLKHAGSYSVKGPISFPSLICGIILNQFPNILNDKDCVCKRASPLLFHHKLFQGTHVPDVVTTSAGPSKHSTTTNKAAMIAILRETCKELESRKLAFEKLISSLETDEGAESADTDVDEQGADNDESDSEIKKVASPDDGTDEDVGLSSSESED
ncbi:uncharacterized protein LOC131636597 [Vicia villosa]|uniref:uncharacterized protein LOC131636597 n=1 Tax=Vicia villosa TaxID=3911 RepID=UPI00273AC5AC|nr:uncharacterized protein LOC131636597 [Vicia villosa]